MDSSAYSTWAFVVIVAVLLAAMLLASTLKRFIPFLGKSLIPGSVMGGLILLIISTVVYYCADGRYLFDLLYGAESGPHRGMTVLEKITYHCLGIGFVAMGMRTNKKKLSKQRAGEVLNTGITTVSGYFVQIVVGLLVTILCVECRFVKHVRLKK